jgi:hypothetical protein
VFDGEMVLVHVLIIETSETRSAEDGNSLTLHGQTHCRCVTCAALACLSLSRPLAAWLI